MVAPNPKIREQAIQLARQTVDQKPVYIDTETTGLDKSDEIVEISIIDHDGSVLFENLVRPSRSIPAGATAVHGITNEMVKTALPFPSLYPRIREYLLGRVVVIYNAPFDLRMLQQSMEIYRLPWRDKINAFDLLPLYSNYRGEWDPKRRGLKWFKLEEAGQFFNISIPNAHRASLDSMLSRAVLHSIAGLPY